MSDMETLQTFLDLKVAFGDTLAVVSGLFTHTQKRNPLGSMCVCWGRGLKKEKKESPTRGPSGLSLGG